MMDQAFLRTRRIRCVTHKVLCRLTLLAFCFFASVLQSGAENVVVNHTVARQSIPKNTVRAIFAMRLRTWPDGSPIKVFVLSDENPIHKEFCKKCLDVFPHQLRWSWDRMVFSGTGQAPIEVSTEEEMREKVGSTPGAIGYLEDPVIDENISILEIR
jgi:ABC-type phosphate transport system substrate-binding protein